MERTWHEVSSFLRTARGDWEILFVCDGCTDDTAQRLTALTRGEAGRIRVLEHSPNRGKGFAVRAGLRAARGAWRIFTDFDLAYGFDDIVRLADTLRGGADVAIASRFHVVVRADADRFDRFLRTHHMFHCGDELGRKPAMGHQH